MMRPSIWKPIAVGTLVCGTLDILLAVILTLWRGKEPAAMLRFVASGPFPDATNWGTNGALLGLATHFALMAIMVAVLVLVVRARPRLLDKPLPTAVGYGLVTYFIMNWLVVPLRFNAPLPPSMLSIVTQLFAHIVLVGIPATLIARRYLRG
ncbi:MAG: hypothetical protein HOQ20_21960 [Bradyrhizobium sp.]|nr:hypothetical protein [Bradyrhizobium sp.]